MERKLPPAIAALLGIAQACVTPCLKITSRETGEQTGDTGTTTSPCLTVSTCLTSPLETGDSGKPTDTGQPVLPPTTGDTGTIGDTGSSGSGDTGVRAADVRARVLGSGRLPDDVVERLRSGR